MDLQNLYLNIFLIRHAQPLNPPNHWTSSTSPLDDYGKEQAKKLAHELEKQVFDKIISSTYVRAIQTAVIIQKRLKQSIELETEEWLSEIDLGVWAGKNKSQIKSDTSYPDFFPKDKAVFQEPLVARLMNTNKGFSFPGGESLETFWNRVQAGFESLINGYRNATEYTIGLVGHGGSFSVINAILLGNSFSDKKIPVVAIKMANYAYIKVYKGRVVFIKVN